MSAQLGLKTTSLQFQTGVVHGFVYLVPKPALRGYAVTLGDVKCATAISFPLGENIVEIQIQAGNTHGLEYLLPNPALRG
jgi:hypothetical protein